MFLRGLIAVLILPLFFVTIVNSISLEVSGGEDGAYGSVAMKLSAEDSAAVKSQVLVDGANLLPITTVTGKSRIFEQTHQVTDSAGKHAEAYVKVVNGKGIKYSSNVQPDEERLYPSPGF